MWAEKSSYIFLSLKKQKPTSERWTESALGRYDPVKTRPREDAREKQRMRNGDFDRRNHG